MHTLDALTPFFPINSIKQIVSVGIQSIHILVYVIVLK